MNCQRNVNSVLPTELPHTFSYVVAIFIPNHFESPNMYNGRQKKSIHHLNVSVKKALITHLDFDVTQK
jgi:hypothetical protein